MSYWQDGAALVCGGSSGLGLAIAEQLAQQRLKHLILIARDEAKLEATRAALSRKTTTDITIIPADLVDFESVLNAAKLVEAKAGNLQLVVQAIGKSDRGNLAELSREHLLQLVDVNVVTSLHAIRAFSPLLVPSQGHIVLIGSLAGLFAPRFLGGYAIAKHGLTALAQQARLELSSQRVSVTLCCPGPIARPDAGSRYDDLPTVGSIPPEARLPGGGAKLSGLAPDRLAIEILMAARHRRSIAIFPRRAWWLRFLSACSPQLGDSILQNRTS
ncbi:MAG: SDR family NAD(P)-dependent oxidoreductase [Planctomycetales bacterium]|nr:SDR family NAD(P)-dependent oxidoreductase [Planctomycetales bacterium]